MNSQFNSIKASSVGPTTPTISGSTFTDAILSSSITFSFSDPIAIGTQAGQNNQKTKSVAIGYQAGQNSLGSYSIAIGEKAGQTGGGYDNCIILNAQSATPLNPSASGQFLVAPMQNATTGNILYYNSGSGEITYNTAPLAAGTQIVNTSTLKSTISVATTVSTNSIILGNNAGNATSGNYSILIGDSAGSFSPSNSYSVAIGYQAGLEQKDYSIHIGFGTGYNCGTNTIAIGRQAGINQGADSIAMGYRAGLDQGQYSVAIGREAGSLSQGQRAVCLGAYSGVKSQGFSSVAIGDEAGRNFQSPYSVAIGKLAGLNSQGTYSLAIGPNAGQNMQGTSCIAIGPNAGAYSQGTSCIAIGPNAGQNDQKTKSVAIGNLAGQNMQGTNSIAIGNDAGQSTQGQYSVAIGSSAGKHSQGTNSIAIGYLAGATNQAANSICINASGTTLPSQAASSFQIAPMRDAGGQVNPRILLYDTTTNEVTYSTASTTSNKTFVIDHPLDNNRYLVHACLEGPESGVYYRGEGFIDKNKDYNCEVELPNYVSKLCDDFTVTSSIILDKNYRNIKILRNSRVSDGKFIVEGDDEGYFSWIVVGRRNLIEVEPKKSDVKLDGYGPYTFLR